MSRWVRRVALALGALMLALIAAAGAQGLGGSDAPSRERAGVVARSEAPSRARQKAVRARSAAAARRHGARIRSARRARAARRERSRRAPGRRGRLRVVPVSRPRERAAAGGRRFSVAVEGGVRVDRRAFAASVERTLDSPRGWGGGFRRVDSGRIDFRVVLSSAGLTDRMCLPLMTRSRYSCARDGVAVLNARRWRGGADSWRGDLGGYRRYMVNHEVGHLLGHGHLPCPSAGARAPVMMQQTKGVGSCRPNAWPRPG